MLRTSKCRGREHCRQTEWLTFFPRERGWLQTDTADSSRMFFNTTLGTTSRVNSDHWIEWSASPIDRFYNALLLLQRGAARSQTVPISSISSSMGVSMRVSREAAPTAGSSTSTTSGRIKSLPTRSANTCMQPAARIFSPRAHFAKWKSILVSISKLWVSGWRASACLMTCSLSSQNLESFLPWEE